MEERDCEKIRGPGFTVSPLLSVLWTRFQSTHVWKCPSHQLVCGIRVLTKTSWPSSLDFNKLQLRVDIGHCECVCVCVGWWHKAACICIYSFISCFCEAEFPLREHGSAPLGGKWACCECVSMLQCVRCLTNGNENKKESVALVGDWAKNPPPCSPTSASSTSSSSKALLSCKWLSWARGVGGGGELEGWKEGTGYSLTGRVMASRDPRLPGSVQHEV